MRPRLQSDAVARALRESGAPPTPRAEDAAIAEEPEDVDRPTDPDSPPHQRAMERLGQVISGRYRLESLLGMGGIGAVYGGRHLLLKKRVAIKVLHPNMKDLPELVARFEREAIAGAHLVHPNVAAATDFGQLADGTHFLVLEYIRGETLHDLIQRERLSAARAVHIARQIASALAAAHAMGIVHRDVKPGNVMLVEGKSDLAKLIDFGLARVPIDQMVDPSMRQPSKSMRPAPRITAVGMMFGTFAYLAPEAAMGMDAVDARSDLYALGIILYQMLAGRHPFDAIDSAALFAQHRLDAPPPFIESAPNIEVPPDLAGIVMRLLAKDPAARYATAADVIEALDALAIDVGSAVRQHRPSTAVPPRMPSLETVVHVAGPPEPMRALERAMDRARWILPLLACAAVALVAVGYFRSAGFASSVAASPPPIPSAQRGSSR